MFAWCSVFIGLLHMLKEIQRKKLEQYTGWYKSTPTILVVTVITFWNSQTFPDKCKLLWQIEWILIMTSNIPLTVTLSTHRWKLSASYIQCTWIHNSSREHGKNLLISLKAQVNVLLHSQTNFNLHYKGEGYSGLGAAVNCSKQCTYSTS